jgi:cyclophilin family peptidyl-prolyl cis-trans isomerase
MAINLRFVGLASKFQKMNKIKYLLVAVVCQLMVSCQSNLDIAQERVIETLLEYGKQNPENKLIINTKFGNIEIKLYNETPLHRANFIRLVKNGYFTDQKIYRIVKGVCVQGGSNNESKLKYLIPSEFSPNLIHKKGALSAARYAVGNPQKMSSPTEFFIVVKGWFLDEGELAKYPPNTKEIYKKIGGQTSFDQEYTVFGEVTKGIDVAEKISELEVTDTDKPVERPRFSIEILK